MPGSSSGRRGRCCSACAKPNRRRRATCRCGSSRRASPCSRPSTTSITAAAEFVVYRATPADVESGVRVGDIEYPGYPAKGAGIATADPALRVAFFALLLDQDRNTPMQVFARDPAGNEAMTPLDHQVFPKPFRQEPHRDRRRVPQPRRAGDRVALAGRGHSDGRCAGGLPEDQRRPAAEEQPVPDGAGEEERARDAVQGRLPAARQLAGRGQVRRHPHLHLQGQGRRPAGAPRLRPRGDRAGADRRGAARASSCTPRDLGIYGNCVVIDHGLGVQSLYGHLSSIDVKAATRSRRGRRSAAAA